MDGPARAAALMLAAALCLGAAPPARPRHYVNQRFGFSADIPPGFVAEAPPGNGDGQAFHAAAGGAALSVWAGYNAAEQSLGDKVADARVECLHEPAEYFVLRAGWAVLSCYTKDGILYTKTLMQGRGVDAVFMTARMTYPVAERSRWDAVAAAFAKSLQPARSD